MSDEDVLHRITAACAGLSYPSERDAPLLPYRFAGEPSAASLLTAEHKPEDTPVEEETLDQFLEGLLDAGAGASEPARAEATAWRALKKTIERELGDVRVYWVGEVDVDAFVLGRAPSGAWLGLRTHAVET